ncbi:MAG: type II toxin-antitoxin system TacA family antitoxin [Mycobacteriales bacterium]
MPRAASERIEVRLRPEQRREVERASALLQMTTSEFIRDAVAARAEQVLTEAAATVVPPDFFDGLLAALDEPPRANPALAAAAQRVPEITRR